MRAVGLAWFFPARSGGTAVDGFKYAAFPADIGPGDQAQAADKTAAEVGNNVTVQVGEDQDVKLVGVLDQLEAEIVHNHLPIGDIGIGPGHLPAAGQKEAVGLL